MSNAEMRTNQLEVDLELALSWQPSTTGRSRMDNRVAAAIAAAGRTPSPTLGRSRTRLILFAGVALLLMGAASAITLLRQTAELMPGHRVAYELAERVNLSQTVDGWTVNLERAYADPNQLVLMFTVSGPQGESQAVVRADVVDAQGRSYLDVAGGDLHEELSNSSASIGSFQVPPGVGGELELTATVDELLPYQEVPSPHGPWVFHFSLPVQPAVVVEPAQTVTAAGVPVTLRTLQITATAVRVTLDVDLSTVWSEQWSGWSLDATLQHAGQPSQDLVWAALPPTWRGEPKSQIGPLLVRADEGWVMVRQTFAGTDAPAGDWTLTIDRLTGSDGSGATTSVEGPWVFTVDVP